MYTFSGDSPTPTIPKRNICQQTEEPFNKTYLVANYINNLNLNDNYTDVEVIAENKTIRAHKVILASHSQYFDSKIWMNSVSRDDQLQYSNHIQIDFQDYKTVSTVLNYMYTTIIPKEIFKNETEFSNLMKAADEFQMEPLKCEISKQLNLEMTIKNLGIIVAMADETKIQFLMTIASKYLLDKFDEVRRTSEWESVIKHHPHILTDAIDYQGKLPNNSYCDIKCIPATLTSPSIFTRLRRCFATQRFTDAEIHVINNGIEKVFHVNRAILIGQSETFRQQFANSTSSSNSIQIYNITDDVMTEFLQYMYSGWTTDKMKEMAEPLLHLSITYEMKPLQTACEDILIHRLIVENAVKEIIIADKANSKRLFSVVLDFILKHRNQVVATKDWAELKKKYPEILTKIFSH